MWVRFLLRLLKFYILYGAVPQLVQDPIGSRACRVNPRFEGSSPSRSAFAVMAQLVQHWS